MRRPTLLFAPWLLGLALTAAPALADEEHTAAKDDYAEELQGFVPGASRLEGRIRAPCCWNQTIDIHGSEIANELRREIRRRLKNGESPDAIEHSLVDRYGERILAVPPGSALKSVAIFLSLGMAGAGVAGFFMLRRWRDRGKAHSAPKEKTKGKATEASSELDARLDAELKALDD